MYSHKRLARKLPIVPLVTILILVIIGYLVLSTLAVKSSIISPLANDTQAITKSRATPSKAKDVNQLMFQIKDITSRQKGTYSVYVYDIKTDKSYGMNETTIFTAASVNKIPVLAALYYETQRGAIDLDQRITLQEKDIQDFGTGVLRYQGAGGVYSLKTLAQLLMEKSDNTAAFVLTQIIGENRIQELVKSWGLTQTDIKNNKTSNKDMALLMVKMYRGQIANEALTTEMIGFMDDSDFEKRLPTLLPDTINVYHKIGNEIGYVHDVGIVALTKNPYYIGVMTNDVIDEPSTEAAIAQISKLIYDFQTTK